MARRFELIEGTSSKFWEIDLRGASFAVCFGRIGTAGQTSEKSFADAAKARAEHDKLVAEKTKKGYAEVGAAEPAAPPVRATPAAPKAFQVFADFHHFLLCDRGCTDVLGDAWDAAAIDDRLALAGGVVGIGTARNTTVPVEIAVLASAPPDDAAAVDHVTECSVAVPSGELVLLGPTDPMTKARAFAVPAGSVVVRVSHARLDTISDDGLRGKDAYRVQLWPGHAQARVLKRWTPPAKEKPAVDTRPPKTFKQAMQLARAGHTELALPKLLELASKEGKDQGLAAYAAATTLAFQGDFAGFLEPARAFLATYVFGAINPFDDIAALLVVAGHATGDWAAVKRAAEAGEGRARAADPIAKLLKALEKGAPALGRRGKATRLDRAAYEKSVAEDRADKKLAARPDDLARRLFSTAVVYGAEDEALAAYERAKAVLYWDDPLDAARILVRRGRVDDAWEVVLEALPRWQGGFVASVGPLDLLIDPALGGVLTPARGQALLATPRGG